VRNTRDREHREERGDVEGPCHRTHC
jgi:hypothetical protein